MNVDRISIELSVLVFKGSQVEYKFIKFIIQGTNLNNYLSYDTKITLIAFLFCLKLSRLCHNVGIAI